MTPEMNDFKISFIIKVLPGFSLARYGRKNKRTVFPQLWLHRAGFLRGRHPSQLMETRYSSHTIIEIEVRFDVE